MKRIFIFFLVLVVYQGAFGQTADDYINSAIERHNKGDDAGAITACDKALQIEPKRAWAYSVRGVAKSHLQLYTDAIADYNQAILIDSTYAAAYCNRGWAKHSLGLYSEAIKDYDISINLEPKDALTLNNRGAAKINLGLYRQAISDFDQAIVLDAKQRYAYNNRGYAYFKLGGSRENYTRAIADYDKAIDLGGKDYNPAYKYREDAQTALKNLEQSSLTADDYIKSAIDEENKSDNEGAIADCDKALQINPQRAWAYNVRGVAKRNLKRNADAIADYDQAIKIDKNYAVVYANRGSTKDDLGRYSEAIDDYTQAITLDPKMPDAYNNRGISEINLGRYSAAISDFDRAIALAPERIHYNNRGYAYFKLGVSKENYTRAIADYDKAIDLGGKDYNPAYKYREDAQTALKNLEQPSLTADDYVKSAIEKHNKADNDGAIADCDKALQIDSKSFWAYNVRGVAKIHLQRYNDAIVDFDQAIGLSSNYAIAYGNRGIAKFDLGRYTEAIADCDRALAFDAKDALTYNTRGLAKSNLGLYTEAISDFDHALALDSKQTIAYNNRGFAYFKLAGNKENFEKALADYDKAIELGGTSYVPYFKYRDEALKAINNLPAPTGSITVLSWVKPGLADLKEDVYETQSGILPVWVRINSSEPINRSNINLLVNGQSIDGNKATLVDLRESHISKTYGNSSVYQYDYKTTVQLPDGSSTYKLVYNGEKTEELKVNYTPSGLNLYVLTIGTKNTNLVYPEKDAEDVAKLFNNQGGTGKIYRNVNIQKVIGTDATAGNMAEKIAELANQPFTSNDVVLVFISSHGFLENNQLRITGSDFKTTQRNQTSLNFNDDILQVLGTATCKKFIFLDACQSGAAVGDKEAFSLNLNNAIIGLKNAANDFTIITSSSENEKSWEDASWQNGAFTKAMKNGLIDGQADANNDHIITVNELYNYLNKQVPAMVLTVKNEQQHPHILNQKGDVGIYVY